MKKWAVILTGVMLTASLSACSSNDEAKSDTPATSTSTPSTDASATKASEETKVPTTKELVQKVTEAGASLKSFSMESTINQSLTMTVDGKEQKQDISMKTKQDMVKEPFAMYQEIESNIPGASNGETIKQYITEDGIYSQQNGTWVKLPDESAKPLLEQMKNAGSPEQQFKQFDSIADQAKVTDEGDTYLLKANLSGDGVKELAKSFLEQSEGANAQAAQLLDQMDIKSMDMSYSVDKKTNYPVDTNVNMVMTMDVEGQKIDMVMDMKGKISKHNSIDKIDIPAEVTNSAK
ncbi:hypothetical protein Q5741_04000 [Paenibacillus sp. JX-17]|uniref:Lipoprotein n=1 Tax=Paenibacillus lacisoli TaxID=3064525 RepID=A0ABT9C8K0_9BACL|nr:DUF6612 family protein [Paenibacillus sp. JX-17]MDO7905572.1 hypothetical protein [Paenibacillus sp. JX-17]